MVFDNSPASPESLPDFVDQKPPLRREQVTGSSLWMIDVHDTENLKKFLDFGFISQKTLQKVLVNIDNDTPAIMKAYLLEQIHQSEKTESDEFSV